MHVLIILAMVAIGGTALAVAFLALAILAFSLMLMHAQEYDSFHEAWCDAARIVLFGRT